MSGEKPLPFLDANIILYAFSADYRFARANALLASPFVTGVQALNEFANVSRRKWSRQWADIHAGLADIRSVAHAIVPVELDTHLAGLDIAERYKLSIYDGCMLAAALRAGCSHFYSEDMQHGLVIQRHLRIINPFLELS